MIKSSKRLTRSRQIVLEAAPNLPPVDENEMQQARSGWAQDEVCTPASAEDCEDTPTQYDWEQVIPF